MSGALESGCVDGSLRIFYHEGDEVDEHQNPHLPFDPHAIRRWIVEVADRWEKEQRMIGDRELPRGPLIDMFEAADYVVRESDTDIEVDVGHDELVLIIERCLQDDLLTQDRVLLFVRILDASNGVISSAELELNRHQVRADIENHLHRALKDIDDTASFESDLPSDGQEAAANDAVPTAQRTIDFAEVYRKTIEERATPLA